MVRLNISGLTPDLIKKLANHLNIPECQISGDKYLVKTFEDIEECQAEQERDNLKELGFNAWLFFSNNN
jgi:hypothetical protein